MKKETRTFNFNIEKRTDGKPMMTGHAAVFDEWTSIGGWFEERIAKGAFKDAVKADDVRALFNHDENHVLGRTTSGTLRLSEDKKGLAVEIDPPDTQFARDLQILMERGDISQMSFAFQVVEEDWEFKDGEPDRRTISKVKLYDVSPVTYPAYEGTDIGMEHKTEARAKWEQRRNAKRLYKSKILRKKLDLKTKGGY